MPTCDRCGAPGTADHPGDPCWPCREARLAQQRDRLDALPTALYRLYDADAALLYVGITHNPKQRWRQHRKTAPWWPQVQHRQVNWFDNRALAAAAEQAAILEELPRHNWECTVPEWLAARDAALVALQLDRLAAEEDEVRRTRRGETRRRLLADIADRRAALRSAQWLP